MKQSLSLILSFGLGTISQSLLTNPVASQVISDETTNTQVIENGNVSEITGGETRGSNLFHSFQDFSVGIDSTAFFDNSTNISNILSRVTGGNFSKIDGLIRANGSANLFLINPAGIIFGQNASLNIGGSFYGSTASSILFDDGEFSAADLDTPPLLTVNAPIGLGFRDNPATIAATGNSETGVNLVVNTGKSFNLIGGEINLSGGEIIAEEGNISLASISQAGTIEFNEEDSLDVSDAVNRSNINLDNFRLQVFSRPSGSDSGNINITAQNFSLTNESRLNNVSQGTGNAGNVNINTTDSVFINSDSAIFTDTFAEGNAGNILIKAENRFVLEGINTDTTLEISASASLESLDQSISDNLTGAAGNIEIDAREISIENNAQILSNTFGSGNAGDITLDADSVVIGKNSSIFSAVGSLESNIQATGNGGKIEIEAQTLSLSDGATIITQTFGAGSAGTININAANSTNISGVSSFPFTEDGTEGGFSSGLFSNSEVSASGSGGAITVTTPTLEISDGAVINARSRGNASAGNILINADVLEITNGSQILATAFNKGAAGNINLNISERINISGTDPNYLTRLNTLIGEFGEAETQFIIDPVSEESGIFANTISGSQGNGGDIKIGVFTQVGDDLILDITQFTKEITIADRGSIAVDSQGSGDSGTISLHASQLTLNNQATIFAETNSTSANQSTNEINIDLQIADSIVFQDDSLISAQAFGVANGGNININAMDGFIVALPSQNQGNDILANSEQVGGNITISSQAIFGLDQGMALDQDGNRLNNGKNDIDATGGEVDGVIEIITPDINSLQRIPQLPENIVESARTVSKACGNDTKSSNNSLILTGKGGIPRTPDSPLDSHNISINGEFSNLTSTIPQPIETSVGKIQPARGIKVTESGGIILTAYRTNNAGDRIPQSSANCG